MLACVSGEGPAGPRALLDRGAEGLFGDPGSEAVDDVDNEGGGEVGVALLQQHREVLGPAPGARQRGGQKRGVSSPSSTLFV